MFFTWIIPMAGRRRGPAQTAGIGVSRLIVGDVDPIGIRLKEGVT
jgi:hypothetical protein